MGRLLAFPRAFLPLEGSTKPPSPKGTFRNTPGIGRGRPACQLRNRQALVVRVNTPTRRLAIETTYDLNDDQSHTAPSVTKTMLVLGIWPLWAAKSPAVTEISSWDSALGARSACFMSFLSWFGDAFRVSPYVRAARRRERRTRPADLWKHAKCTAP